MLWIACSVLMLGTDSDSSAATKNSPATVDIRGCQWEAVSQNFTVRNYHASHDARKIADYCERLRTKLQKYWTAEQQEAWAVKCEVVAHANSGSYLATVGAGARQTFGSSLIKFDGNKQVARRVIDFRGDSALGVAAVPHEMTHVILADLLDGRQPPRWADEGMAILADTPAKQALHERDLRQGLASRSAFRVGELLTIESYPAASRMAAFYGQSASLTACLARRDDPAKFVEFLRRALADGYDSALRDVYHFNSVAELEQHWQGQRLNVTGISSHDGVSLAVDDAAAVGAARAD